MSQRDPRASTARILAAVVAGMLLAATVASAQGTAPRLTAVDAASYQALKVQAETDAAAEAPTRLAEVAAGEAEAPTITASFAGLDQPGAASGGFTFVPPDPILAKGRTRVLEATNSATRLFTTAGGVLATKSLQLFFGAPPPAGRDGVLFDPKVYFDRLGVNPRFYVVALEKRGTSDATGVSRIWLAVSRGVDPADLEPARWCRYAIDGKRNGGTARSSWADYPGLGVGVDKLVITANQFTFASNLFTFAIVRVLNKLVLANNGAACPPLPFVFTFQPSALLQNPAAFTLQPVQHYVAPASSAGVANPVYLVNTVFGTNTRYRVWRVRNLPPSLQVASVQGTFTYGVPPAARQRGSSLRLDTGDNRITQASSGDLRGSFSAVHGTVCNVGGGATESCVRAVAIRVGSGPGGALAASLEDQFTLGLAPGDFLFWPGVADGGSRDSGFAFHRSSATTFLSSYWAVGTTIRPLTVGTCPQRTARTGDYIGAQRDPVDNRSFWFAGERATTLGGVCQWQTRIIRVTP
ncbi:MAG TPA: hypothetical protein VGX21_23270 [Methylomirabilota bacterium]|nr:hypothetical protein [Methylomirabilota bacterium]